ncbi:sigma factor-like helix-turn-helix DNA-binding protein [Brevundimonas vesicularis]|uniref:sigma factor-like helix-turn-helix DNA-binding protein n=1 Tax=Brevundimonas vesicularis TaxID=41276 RepID=UPI0022EC46B6|nr:sigma factor-like helix-turn-helix DNA-binding protein [Brevundimonas vesicularis]WBT05675.1 sigma factor-like helix-turn-helix DNA-binding protein [Brevundimonas vesicularis]
MSPIRQTQTRSARAAEKAALKRTILDLPPETRSCFLRHLMAGLTCGEIAAQLGMEPGEVEAHRVEALLQTLSPTPPAQT